MELPTCCLYFINKCRVADTTGVERWALDGALLMNLFKTSQPARSAEDEAAALRLRAIAHRSKAGRSPDSGSSPEVPDAPAEPENLQ